MTDQEETDFNRDLWASLRNKGHKIQVHVVDRMMVMVDGVDMTFDEAKALDMGRVTLDEIARLRGKPTPVNSSGCPEVLSAYANDPVWK